MASLPFNYPNLQSLRDKIILLPIYVISPHDRQTQLLYLNVDYNYLSNLCLSAQQRQPVYYANFDKRSTSPINLYGINGDATLEETGYRLPYYQPFPPPTKYSTQPEGWSAINQTKPLRRTSIDSDYQQRSPVKLRSSFESKPLKISPRQLTLDKSSSQSQLPNDLEPVIKAINRFLSQCCQIVPDHSVSRNQLQRAYDKWRLREDEIAIAGNVMAEYLDRIYTTYRKQKKIYYKDLALIRD